MNEKEAELFRSTRTQIVSLLEEIRDANRETAATTKELLIEAKKTTENLKRIRQFTD